MNKIILLIIFVFNLQLSSGQPIDDNCLNVSSLAVNSLGNNCAIIYAGTLGNATAFPEINLCGGIVNNDYFPGMRNYRLRQTDLSGDISYSELRQILIENHGVHVSPNPNKGFSQITVENYIEIISIELIDSFGRKVLEISDPYAEIIPINVEPEEGVFHLRSHIQMRLRC